MTCMKTSFRSRTFIICHACFTCFMSIWLEPADRPSRAPWLPEPMFEWPLQIQTKPAHQIRQLSVIVVRKLLVLNQIESSTKQTRRNVRVFIDLTTNKSDEHQVHHLLTPSKYLVAV